MKRHLIPLKVDCKKYEAGLFTFNKSFLQKLPQQANLHKGSGSCFTLNDTWTQNSSLRIIKL